MPFQRENMKRKVGRAPPKVRGTINHDTIYKVVSCRDGVLHGWMKTDYRYQSQPDKNGESGWNIQHSGELEMYENGFHVTTKPYGWYHTLAGILLSHRVFEVEYKGEILHSHTTSTSVVRQFRFVREVYPNTKTKTGFSRRKPK